MHFIITLIFFLNIFLNAVHITVEKLQRKFCTSVKNEICFSKSNLDFIKFQYKIPLLRKETLFFLEKHNFSQDFPSVVISTYYDNLPAVNRLLASTCNM